MNTLNESSFTLPAGNARVGNPILYSVKAVEFDSKGVLAPAVEAVPSHPIYGEAKLGCLLLVYGFRVGSKLLHEAEFPRQGSRAFPEPTSYFLSCFRGRV